MEQKPQRLERVADAARRLSISTPQLYRLVQRGDLVKVKLGPQRSAILSSSVDDLIARRIEESRKCVGGK